MLESLEDFFVLESRGPRSDGSDPRAEGFGRQGRSEDRKGEGDGEGGMEEMDGDEGALCCVLLFVLVEWFVVCSVFFRQHAYCAVTCCTVLYCVLQCNLMRNKSSALRCGHLHVNCFNTPSPLL